MQKKHEDYTKLLNKCNFEEKSGVLWGKVLNTCIWGAFNITFFKAIVTFIHTIFFSNFEVNLSISGNKKVLIRNCNTRQDYNRIWSNFKSCFNDFDLIELRRKRCFDIKIISNLTKCKRVFYKLPTELPLKDRLYFTTWVIRILRLEQLDIKQLKLAEIGIFFFDGDPMENYLCQVMKRYKPGCITATLQHGQYVYKGNEYDINQTGILNLTADYVLGWGPFTKKQFIKAGINENRIIQVGNLLNPIDRKIDYKINSSNSIFGLILDSPSYYFAIEKNKEMIKLASQLAKMSDLKFWVKLHPVDSEDNYIITSDSCLGFYPKEKLIKEYAEEIEFALLHVSSAYIDLLLLNCKSFKYNSEIEFPLVENKNESFDNIDELKKKYQAWTLMSNKNKMRYLSENRENYIVPGNTFKNYRDKIQELLGE